MIGQRGRNDEFHISLSRLDAEISIVIEAGLHAISVCAQLVSIPVARRIETRKRSLLACRLSIASI